MIVKTDDAYIPPRSPAVRCERREEVVTLPVTGRDDCAGAAWRVPPSVQNFRMGSEGNWFFLHDTWIKR